MLFLCRVALIPAYAFGETELYIKQIFTPGGFVNRFQKWFQSMVHIYPCAFYGHGFIENSWGLLPYARPVTTIGELALVLAASSGTQDPVPRLDLGSGHVQRQVTGQDERRGGGSVGRTRA